MKTILWKTNDKKSNDTVRDYVAYLNDKDKDKQVEYLITFKKNRAIRSTSQNGYYRIVLIAIANITGDTDDDLHEFFKKKFLGKEIHGEVIGGSSAKLDTAEFTEYLNKVIEYSKSFFNVEYIPKPEDRAYNAWAAEMENGYNAMFRSI